MTVCDRLFGRSQTFTTKRAGQVLSHLPEAISTASRHVDVGGDLAATFAVSGYPAEVGMAWLEPLFSYGGRIDVAVHIVPVAAQVAASRLTKQRARLESSRRDRARKGRLDDPDIDAAAEDAAELAGRIARGEGRLFKVGVYLTVWGENQATLDERTAELRSQAASMLLATVPVTFRQMQGWLTTRPLGVDALQIYRTMDTSALAASFPFSSPDLPTPARTVRPIVYGLNANSAGLLVWDRWAQDNYNAVIIGRSGAGKSYLAKLDLDRNLHHGVHAIVIDPEDEYIPLAKARGGLVIQVGSPDVRINPLDLSSDDDAFVKRGMFLKTVLEVLTGAELNGDEAAALNEAIIAAYAKAGIGFDPRTWRRPAPLLRDLAAALATQGPHGRTLAGRLHPYVEGSFRRLFDGPSTVRIDSHLVVFATRDLADELKPAATLLILDAIERRLISADRLTPYLLHVDEAWLLLRTGSGARFLETMAKRSRKYHAGLTLVTQDAADMLSTDLGTKIIANCATQILARQAAQNIDAIADAFGLTDGERAYVLTAPRGSALLCGDAHAAFTAIAAPDEHELLLTGPPTD